MRTKPQRIALGLSAGLLAVALAGCTASAPETTPERQVSHTLTTHAVAPTDLDTFCDQAELLASRDPQGAIDLIDAVRAPAKEAADRDLASLTADQKELLNACWEVRVSAAAKLVREAVSSAEADVVAENEEKAGKTPAETVGDAWADVIENWFAPLTGLGLLIAGMIAGLLILARFATLIPKVRQGWRRRWKARVAFWLGSALIVAGSIATARLLTGFTERSTLDGWGEVAIAIAIALFGSWLMATYLASRLRLTVEGQNDKGEPDKWATARIVTALATMGAAPSRGLEIPSGSDIEALAEAALPSIPSNKVLAVVQSVFRMVFLGTPWRITVIQHGERSATVSVIHNGESVERQLIDLDDRFELPDKVDAPSAVLTFASAAILIALSRRHSGFEGLAGTESWRSLGLQVLAARYYKLGEPELETMLKAALAFDSGNHVATFALENARNRDTIVPADLNRYYESLIRELKAAKKLKAKDLAFRIRLVSSLIAINVRSAGTPTADLRDAGHIAIQVIESLRRRSTRKAPDFGKALQLQGAIAFEMLRRPLRTVPKEDAKRENLPPDVKKLTAPADLRPDSAAVGRPDPDDWGEFVGFRLSMFTGRIRALRARRTAQAWIHRTAQSQAPRAAYNHACYDARIGNFRSALTNLEVAVTEDWLREYARKDRDLRELSLAFPDEFRKLTEASPRDDLWKLEPFAKLKSKLIEAGVTSPERLIQRPDDRRLAIFLEVQRPVMVRLRNLARLIKATEGAGTGVTSELRVELISTLMDAGVESPELIPEAWTDQGTLDGTPIREGVTKMVEDFRRSIDNEALANWLSAVRTAGYEQVDEAARAREAAATARAGRAGLVDAR
jgi:hypothetical protein